MKVYSVLCSVEYEGQELLGVFANRESAIEFVHKQDGFGKWAGYSWGIVESELGASINFYETVEWVN